MGSAKRSFPVKPGDYLRVYNTESLDLQIHLSESTDATRVRLHTDLNTTGDWHHLDFENQGDGNFHLSAPVEHCGEYHFKVQYSYDDGENWIWDRVPFVTLIVDPQQQRHIAMYTLIPTVSGTCKDWIERVKDAHAMGFNMIHLLPVTAMGKSESPYAAYDLFALDRSYHSKRSNGLKAFEKVVETCRDLNVGICSDLVLNHVGIDSHIVESCPDWIVPDKNEPDGLMRPGCWHMNDWIKWTDLARINYDHPEPKTRQQIWDYMTEYALFWAGYADYTGGCVRFDNLHASHEQFINHISKTLRKNYPDLIIFAEYFADTNTLLKHVPQWGINMLLGTPWEYPYAANLRGYLRYLHSVSDQLAYLIPLTSHDTGAPTQLYGDPKASQPRYATLALMGSGQTGIVQGSEFGVPEKIAFIGRHDRMDFDTQIDLREFFAQINTITVQNETFQQANNLKFIDNEHGAVLVAHRWDKKGHAPDFIVGANLDIYNGHQLRIPITELAGNCKPKQAINLMTLEKIAINDAIDLNLGPCEVCVFQLHAG